MKREASITPKIEKYLKQNRIYCNYEIKQTTSDSIPFCAVETHQVEGLLAGQDEGIVWKLSDSDPREKPCDGFSIPPLPGMIIIKYPKAFVLITINNFIHARDTSKKKSLDYEQAREIAEKIIY